jgi:hypothetical protein
MKTVPGLRYRLTISLRIVSELSIIGVINEDMSAKESERRFVCGNPVESLTAGWRGVIVNQ